MSKEELLRHRMLKFRSIGGYQEGIPIDPERKRKMKPSQINTSSNASDLELELESLKRNILEAKGPANPITDQSIKKLKQDIDKMITSAFISMGLQEKLESLKLELSKNPTDKNLNQGFKEKADLIMQEFKRNLSKPGAYIGLKEKLEKLNMVEKIMDLKAKNEKIKNEINSKIPLELKTKMLNLKNAQEKVLKGDALEKDLLEEVEKVKEELKNFLKMANLEVLEVAKRKPAISYLELENVNEKIEKEIEKAINVAGISEKIEKLKVEIAKDSNSSEVEKLRVDIKEGIMSTLNVSDLKEKYDKLIQELKNSKETTMEGDVVGENGRC